jgi:hypothetical protein
MVYKLNASIFRNIAPFIPYMGYDPEDTQQMECSCMARRKLIKH